MASIVIVAALKDEIGGLIKGMEVMRTYRKDRAHFFDGKLDGRSVIVGFTGIGAEATFKGLKMLRELVKIDTVIGVGYAGALAESLETGSLILASEILRASGDKIEATFNADDSLLSVCRKTLAEDKMLEEGRVITLKNALTDPEQKREAAQKFGAIAVDMESAALAAFCEDRQIPFIVLRAILDPVSVKVPDPSEFLDREKRISKRKILKYVAKNPQAIWELPRLGAQAKQVRQRIAEVMPKVIHALATASCQC